MKVEKESGQRADHEIAVPGNANLLIGSSSANANLPIGSSSATSNLPIGASGVPGNANLPIGSFPRWHSRGYLPHFDSSHITQHVTFHLADSLPAEVVKRLEAQCQYVDAKVRDVERRKTIEAWVDAGHGSCILRESAVARTVQDALLFFDAQRYRVFAWVIMPNHVHVLFQPCEGWTVAKIVASWKKFAARRICDWRRNIANREIGRPVAPGNADLLIGESSQTPDLPIASTPAVPGNADLPIGSAPVWHREYWDRYMRNSSHFQQAMDYIHQNPVKAGLVASAEDWPWSSAAGESWSTQTANRKSGCLAGEGRANQEIGGPGI